LTRLAIDKKGGGVKIGGRKIVRVREREKGEEGRE
jgi:hypothetical protein